jgi:hypothetical protein
MIDTLEDWIKSSQNSLETTYNQLGDRFRAIVDILDNMRASASQDDSLYPIRETRISINQVSGLMEETGQTRKGLGQFISEYRQNLRQLKIIDQNISRIHEYSEIMELLAMNTVVFSVQSSKDVGFIYVADILRNNAKSSIDRIEEIVDIGRNLREQFTLLEESILKLKREESITNFIDKKIRGSLAVVEDSQEFFAETTALLDEEIGSVHGDLLKIVQEIQYQDIFRQSLDHVLLLLKNSGFESDSLEQKLDKLCYMETVCRFSIPLLDEIVIRIDSSVVLFQTRLEGVRRDMIHIMERRRSFLQDNLQKSRKKGGLLCSVGDLKTGLNELHRELVCAEKELKNIENSTDRSSGVINTLHEKIIDLDSLILTYYNITRLGKKEMLKYPDQEYLRDSLDSIFKLAKKIERTGDTIHKAMVLIEEGRIPVKDNIRSVKESKKGTALKVEAQAENLKRALIRLLEGVKKLQEQNARLMTALRVEINEALSATGGLKSVADGLRSITGALTTLERKVIEEKETALKSAGTDDWTVKNGEFQKMLDRFTIYRQKLAISQLMGISQKEEGLKEGNIILF